MNLTIGDHLVTPRTVYTHHGLYVGDDSVIHYSGLANDNADGDIEIVSLAKFANQKEVYVRTHIPRNYSREESIDRAYSRLGEDKYNVLFNNCEHFVNWCIDGEHKSEQVDQAVDAVLLAYEQHKNKNKIPSLQTNTPTDTMLNTARQKMERQVVQKTVSTVAGFATTSALAIGVSSTTTTVVSSILATSAAPALAPIAAGVAVCYGVSKVIDWFWE